MDYSDEAVAEYDKDFRYDTKNRLVAIEILNSGKEYDVLSFDYGEQEVNVSSKALKQVKQRIVSENGKLKTYQQTMSNKYHFQFEGQRLAKFEFDDTCNGTKTDYLLNYNEDGVLNSLYHERQDVGAASGMTYEIARDEKGVVLQVSWKSKNSTAAEFKVIYDSEHRIKSIVKSQWGKMADKVTYGYDENGNIVLEEHFGNSSGREFLYNRLEVSYTEAKGNDKQLLWENNNWPINLLFNQRSYLDFVAPCY